VRPLSPCSHFAPSGSVNDTYSADWCHSPQDKQRELQQETRLCLFAGLQICSCQQDLPLVLAQTGNDFFGLNVLPQGSDLFIQKELPFEAYALAKFVTQILCYQWSHIQSWAYYDVCLIPVLTMSRFSSLKPAWVGLNPGVAQHMFWLMSTGDVQCYTYARQSQGLCHRRC